MPADAALYIHREGEGDEVVVLLHGLTASGRYWSTLLPHLQGPYRFVAPDLLGFGRSPWPSVGYTPDVHLAALERHVFSQVPDRIHLVGHSLGALLAHEWAGQHPERVHSLVLLAMPYFDDEDEIRRVLSRESAWVCLDLRARPLAWLACQCICQQRRIWGPALPHLLPHLPEAAVRDSLLHSFHSFDSTLRDTLFPLRPELAAQRLEAAEVRVHHLGHAGDRYAPAERLTTYVERHRNASLTLVEAPGDGHLFSLHAPASTGAVVAAALVESVR